MSRMRVQEVRDKYPLLYKAMQVNMLAQGKEDLDKRHNNTISSCFAWSKTPEKFDFWKHVDAGNIKQAKKMIPELFGPDIVVHKDYSEVKNGLW